MARAEGTATEAGEVVIPHFERDVGVDVRDGAIVITRRDPVDNTVHEFALSTTAARFLGDKLLASAYVGTVEEPTPGWDEIDARAKAYVAKCKRIAIAIESPTWHSFEVQLCAKSIL
jgi:hypothetical protein